MLALIPFTFGNRQPDIFGNVHTARDDRGRTVFRDPGDYRGSHRAVQPLILPLRLLARWEGIGV